MFVDWNRCQIVHPDGHVPRGRFVYKNGIAAVWVEDRPSRTAERVLYATGANFERQATARVPNILHLAGDSGVWTIIQQPGGCGCGSRLKGYNIDDLLDPQRNSI